MPVARMEARPARLTSSLDTIGQMICNPAIGGVATGHIVREIDALDGIVGQAIDATGVGFAYVQSSKDRPRMARPRASRLNRIAERAQNLKEAIKME